MLVGIKKAMFDIQSSSSPYPSLSDVEWLNDPHTDEPEGYPWVKGEKKTNPLATFLIVQNQMFPKFLGKIALHLRGIQIYKYSLK